MNRINIRYNVMSIGSIEEFARIRGGFRQGVKDVYFVRCLGCDPGLDRAVSAADRLLTGEMAAGRLSYCMVREVPGNVSPGDVSFYRNILDERKEGDEAGIRIRCSENNPQLAYALKEALDYVGGEYRKSVASCSDSMVLNFRIKMLNRIDKLLGDILKGWFPGCVMKAVFMNVVKDQDYLFCMMLTRLGCDVLLIQTAADISEKMSSIGVSSSFRYGDYSSRKICIAHPEPAAAFQGNKPVNEVKPARVIPAALPHDNRSEKSYEELAALASSVVMIEVLDECGEVMKTGSGIMTGSGGYILTNAHVAGGGRYYSVRIEDDEQIYRTDELIKYHHDLDLAIIRIHRNLKPLPIYSGTQELVRGQKVVAIGSPLGLFNSVSDGIISGFRTIDGVDMIQFTAPISNGSSGGALLNMYGELIGISTAGFDAGQNINLAVGYENIRLFTRGFTG